MRKILWKQVQTRKITSSNLETNLAFHIYFTILANTRGLSGGFSAEKGGKIDIETMVILDETKTSRRKSVTDGKDTPGTGKIDGKKSLGTGKTDRKRKVISAPEKNTESSASKKTRIETISSLSSDDELEKNPVKSKGWQNYLQNLKLKNLTKKWMQKLLNLSVWISPLV